MRWGRTSPPTSGTARPSPTGRGAARRCRPRGATRSRDPVDWRGPSARRVRGARPRTNWMRPARSTAEQGAGEGARVLAPGHEHLAVHDGGVVARGALDVAAGAVREVVCVLGQREPQAVEVEHVEICVGALDGDRKSTRLNSSHVSISYAVFCLKKKKGESSVSGSGVL